MLKKTCLILFICSLPTLAFAADITKVNSKKRTTTPDIQINRKDFMSEMESAFDDLDKNHDGIISTEETMSKRSSKTSSSGKKAPPSSPTRTQRATVYTPPPAPVIAKPAPAANKQPENDKAPPPKTILPATGIPPVNGANIINK